MGRLFWKFLFAFWLAVSIAGLGVGTTVWLRHQVNHPHIIDLNATAFILLAQLIHEEHGDERFIDFLKSMESVPGPSIYAIDESGADILGRETTAGTVAAIKKILSSSTGYAPVAHIILADGKNYFLYSPQQTDWKKSLPKLLSSFSQSHPEFAETISQLPIELTPRGTNSTLPITTPSALPSLLTLLFTGSFASFIFSWILAWYFTRPIKQLRQAFSRIANGDFKTRLKHNLHYSYDEFTELGSSFNEMASKIQNLITAQQNLLHDVSHELRSPLARMQAAIGIAQQQPQKVGSILTRLEKDSQRISDLVGELLFLSKLESGVNEESQQKVDLIKLISDIVDDARFEAQTKRIKINYSPATSIFISAHPILLQRAIENIIRNAIKYSYENTSIDIEVEHLSVVHNLKIRIRDQGPGVNQNQLENIFKPFVRAGNEHIRDSVGLGLTIALRAITYHGGIIQANNQNNGGLCMTITLPGYLVTTEE